TLRAIGATGSHFTNPTGLHDEDHYTTVYDLYLLMRQFARNRMLCEIASSKDGSGAALQPDGSYVVKKWRSTNSILLGYTEVPETVTVLAAKTGYTVSAGRCLLMAVRGADGDVYIVVIANAASHDILYQEMVTLLNMIAE
ncbi:MAG: D-alanyl-D-alanine carboxypeptidase, partial [Lachnospiraceae bacterium]|nr:D-alanyl-D-alanine carboxypeptidase [Lachnospiraceae bacterium]